MCFCMVQLHSRKFRKPVAPWVWQRGLNSIPSNQRCPLPNVSADHSRGVSSRPVPVAPDREQDLSANGVVFMSELVPHFADAHHPLRGPLTPDPLAGRLRGLAVTVANPDTSRKTAERHATRCTSTCPATLPPQPRKVPVAPHAEMAVDIDCVDQTSPDEPVVRKTRSGGEGG